MEMSNLPQYKDALGDKENKEKTPTRYMVTIVCFFLKHEMCDTAPNISK